MPTYEYECGRCGHQFEAFQSITADPLTECPECGGPVKRLISAGAGLIFKGSGFYITDYKKGKAGETSSAKPAEKKTEKSEPSAKNTSSDKS